MIADMSRELTALRQQVTDQRKDLLEQSKIIAKIDNAFFQPPLGRDKSPTLYQRLNRMLWIAENGGFSIKWGIRIISGLALVVGSIATIKSGIFK
ncbi:hypothetical protein BMI86_10345 [Thioclava sp. DLFJ5-1]|uniref:hypothetical protein n=1 Tax=Thioclava sp. DLFJ5-1 TaxID=1915314 RepID=UPI0009C6CB73|nr:hypothetical protein [Thioclava sp. DLFJ5-1]OOY20896.1 hypothetical protein BMI86_10345 [Thioclava sp. DLFJ5-1]